MAPCSLLHVFLQRRQAGRFPVSELYCALPEGILGSLLSTLISNAAGIGSCSVQCPGSGAESGRLGTDTGSPTISCSLHICLLDYAQARLKKSFKHCFLETTLEV